MSSSSSNSVWRLITNGDLVLSNGRVITGGSLLVVNGRIRDIYEKTPASLLLERDNIEVLDATNCWVTPGLIDQHINGGYGVLFNTASMTDIHQLLSELLKVGITGIVPTVITANKTDLMAALTHLEEIITHPQEGETRILGIHLEGPFLNPSFRGAHPQQHLLELSQDNLQGLLSPHVKMVTLAPELDPDCKVIDLLHQKGILPSLGHSSASYDIAKKAIDAGAHCITHMFNAMAPFHHRNPGLVGAALLDERVYVEVIADGKHLAPETIELIIKTKSLDNVILVSDANALTGSPLGHQTAFGGQAITLTDQGAINEEGKLAGSSSLLPQAIKNLVDWGVLTFPKAIQTATQNPAQHLGEYPGFGELSPNSIADILFWNKTSLTVEGVMLEGDIVHSSAKGFTKDMHSTAATSPPQKAAS